MISFNDLLNKYRKYSFSERDKGNKFERLMQAYLLTDPKYKIVYSKEFCRAFALLSRLNQNPSSENLTNLQYLLSKKFLIGKKWITSKMIKY